MGIRRVVTGHNEAGRAVFVSDTVIEPVTLALVPETEFYRLWGSEQRSRFPDDGAEPVAPTYFPGPSGFRFGVFTVAPNTAVFTEDLDVGAALVEMEEKLPGMAAHMEPENPGTVIQNGTRHAWRNPYDEPAMMAVVLIAADHSGV